MWRVQSIRFRENRLHGFHFELFQHGPRERKTEFPCRLYRSCGNSASRLALHIAMAADMGSRLKERKREDLSPGPICREAWAQEPLEKLVEPCLPFGPLFWLLHLVGKGRTGLFRLAKISGGRKR